MVHCHPVGAGWLRLCSLASGLESITKHIVQQVSPLYHTRICYSERRLRYIDRSDPRGLFCSFLSIWPLRFLIRTYSRARWPPAHCLGTDTVLYNWERVIIDDGNVDDTRQVVMPVVKSDPHFPKEPTYRYPFDEDNRLCGVDGWGNEKRLGNFEGNEYGWITNFQAVLDCRSGLYRVASLILDRPLQTCSCPSLGRAPMLVYVRPPTEATMLPPRLRVLSSGMGPDGSSTARVARAQKILRLHPSYC